MNQNRDYYDQLVSSEWQLLIELTSEPAHQLLMALTDADISLLVDDFYAYMLDDRDAGVFLSSEQVKTRLHATLAQWVKLVLSSSRQELATLIALQRKIGEVHARIGIPIDLVARGVRRLKQSLYNRLQRDIHDVTLGYEAMRFSSLALDTAIEVMTTAYSRSYESTARDKENYRLFSIMDNVNVERERQLGAVVNWENRFIYTIATGLPLNEVQRLAGSEFGLWFEHKGRHVFEQSGEVKEISRLLSSTDQFIAGYQDRDLLVAEQRYLLLRSVRSAVAAISTLLSTLFDELSKYENGKDPLTNLLNRRFIPTILRREIALAARSSAPFVIAMIDVDHFKRINDSYGHDTGDRALRSIATLLHENVRSSDYVFRYGGEEFMVVFVETHLDHARRIVEVIHQKLAMTPLHTAGGDKIPATISVGLCAFDGHPDYERLISKADEALYRAKKSGRNRTEVYE